MSEGRNRSETGDTGCMTSVSQTIAQRRFWTNNDQISTHLHSEANQTFNVHAQGVVGGDLGRSCVSRHTMKRTDMSRSIE